MVIIETTIISRSNTNISWPNIEVDPNDPYELKTNFTTNISISDDLLSRTIIRTWESKELFIQDKQYSNTSTTIAWYNALANDGITFNRTISTSA